MCVPVYWHGLYHYGPETLVVTTTLLWLADDVYIV